MGTLRRQLENGDQVEVLTHPDAHPSRDWLYPDSGYLNTSRARAKVAQWFKRQARDQNLAEGRQMVLRELDRLDLSQAPLQGVAEVLNVKSTNDLFAAVGAGDVRVGQVVHTLLKQTDGDDRQQEDLPLVRTPSSQASGTGSDDIFIEGVGNLMTQIANCCQPLPGDQISGFVSQGRGVVVHRSDCPNLLHMEAIEPNRILQVSWGMQPSQTYPVEISILAYDRTGLLRDVSMVMANKKVNVIGVNTQSNRGDNTASMQLTVEMDSLQNLSTVINEVEQLPNVMSARRIRSGEA
jgi:GTP pyrophosphokinase